jgi:elongation factor P hydroxylase
VSVDNPELARSGLLDTAAFQRAVLTQALAWQQQGLPERAGIFYAALCREFGTAVPAAELIFTSVEFAR